jgi:hypothetical protein
MVEVITRINNTSRWTRELMGTSSFIRRETIVGREEAGNPISELI